MPSNKSCAMIYSSTPTIFLLIDAMIFQFSTILDLEGLHRAFLSRQVTLFAPSNAAVAAFKAAGGRSTEDLVLNHLANIALGTEQLPDRLSSLVTGNPPLWVSRERRGRDGRVDTFVNQARIVRPDLAARSERGDEQVGKKSDWLDHSLFMVFSNKVTLLFRHL